VISSDVAPDALAVERGEVKRIPGWAARNRAKKQQS
jgi:hypothetical protein